MLKLTYTEEMKEQDRLYENEQEDRDVMERLHNNILGEAKRMGFTGVAEVINYNDWHGVNTELFHSQEDLEKERQTGDGLQIAICGYCRALIENLEEILNKQ